MKRCPKCRAINAIAATECDGCGVIFADIRKPSQPSANRECPWNDHGVICGLVGSLSDNTKGEGPWYCSTHFWKLKGYPEASRKDFQEHISYRDREFPDAEPAALDDVGKLKSIATDAKLVYDRLRSGELGKRGREPGEDDEEIAA